MKGNNKCIQGIRVKLKKSRIKVKGCQNKSGPLPDLKPFV
jgi:hypothetical protein